MPRIRKKTSKRGTLNQRARIAKKVQETHRKQKRAARKAPPKKSKPKDPGIPNAFPYKDQILAEIAEQRRQATEEKQRRKDEKKAAKSNAADGSEASGDEGDGAFDGVLSLNASAQSAPRKGRVVEPVVEDHAEAEEEETPILVNPDLPDLKSVLDAADVVLEVLDARDPLAARSAHVEGLARESGKRVLLVLNKIDVCPREAVEAWATTLRKEHPTVLFRSASASLPAPAESVKGKAKERVDDAWGLDATLAVLQQWANEKKGDSPLTVAVVGVTNVGKSAVVNSLLRKAALQTYKLTSAPPETPTTTTHPQEVMLELEGKSVRLIDTPGLSWHPSEDASEEELDQARARDVLLRNRGHIERLKDPAHVMSGLVTRAAREDLMLLYNLPIFTEGDANSFLAGVARAHRFMKKRGDPDLTAAARMVLRDWSNGKLARYTMPASPSADAAAAAPTDPALAEAYAKDGAVLGRLASRKELRKAGGLVKLRAGAIDTRRPTLDESYSTGSDDEADEEDGAELDELDDNDLDEEDIDEEDDDDDDEDEEDEDEEEEEAPSPRGKRKRSATKAAASARPAKKVAFAAEPKGTKQARSAAGARGAAKASDDKPAKKPSALKKAAPAKPAAAKKVANSSTGSKKAAAAPVPAKDGEVEYDFKQFF
ncbi:Guanine nucleotide-binding protein-like 3 -like protein [Trametes pubescens]|uniref:Guanine nucleotide-binding protein-like 3-like protein n=1 Tax=Trametes pubescens TaxID=154538 RepID=A0A1M2VA87_TRAPU|nr:Guanine nucleotide-binding protein-like 3 -like protein [Trametes pubescens]